MFGLIGKFTAQPGKRDDLVAILVQAAADLRANPACIAYIVGTSDEPDAIWVSEVWTDKAAHAASLDPPEVRALIERAMPLIAGISDQTELRIVGGKGI
jgi:quinol monooxygenase YgiN